MMGKTFVWLALAMACSQVLTQARPVPHKEEGPSSPRHHAPPNTPERPPPPHFPQYDHAPPDVVAEWRRLKGYQLHNNERITFNGITASKVTLDDIESSDRMRGHPVHAYLEHGRQALAAKYEMLKAQAKLAEFYKEVNKKESLAAETLDGRIDRKKALYDRRKEAQDNINRHVKAALRLEPTLQHFHL